MADEFNIGEEIIAGIQEVFSTMLMVDLQPEEVIENGECEIASNLTSMIGLGGGIRGMLAIHCPASVARGITSGLLGMEVLELDEDVKDAVGEVANMVAGNLKISFAKSGIDIELAIPTSIVGNSFVISGMADAERIVAVMKAPEGPLWIELLYIRNT
jgi:chemotaxis protein CheX